MPFLEDVKPIVTGPLLRFLAAWIEVVVFSLTLLSGFSIISFVSFGLLFFVGIFDIALGVRRKKYRKVARLLDQDFVFQPKIWIIVVDFLIGAAFTAFWLLFVIWNAVNEGSYYSSYYYGYSVFAAYVMVGNLAIAHVHIFTASVEVHLLRQKKNGAKAAARAHSREVSKHGSVELVNAGAGPSAMHV